MDGINPSLPIFLARPMSKVDRFGAEFFRNVELKLVQPALKAFGSHLNCNFELKVGPCQSSIDMMQDIINDLESAFLCIFDISGLNHNVLIEYGYRRAIGNNRPVVIACKDILGVGDLPFDLRQQSVLFYSAADLKANASHLIADLLIRMKDAIKVHPLQPSWANTDMVYMTYERLSDKDDLLIWVATWPAFPGTPREKILEHCQAKSIVVAGPLKSAAQLPGIIWRLDIRERRKRHLNTPFFMYGQLLPTLKMIVAGEQAFLAPEAAHRTARYYRLPNATKLKEVFYSDLVGARTIEEEIYQFLLDHIQKLGRRSLNSIELRQLFFDEISADTEYVSPEASKYPPDWILEGFRRWIPRCVEWVEENRGWKALELKSNQSGEFSLRLGRGDWLSKRHSSYLVGASYAQSLPVNVQERPLPKLRIVVTNRCNLGCSYCPPENEDYKGGSGSGSLKPDDLSTLLEAAFRCNFRSLSITGGEPLLPDQSGNSVVKAINDFLSVIDHRGVTVAIQTNGTSLSQFLDKLERYKSQILLKISVDALQAVPELARTTMRKAVVSSIELARKRGFKIGVNLILTDSTAQYAKEVIEWAHSIGVYIKILDLNWYTDIGGRCIGIGATAGLPISDMFWSKKYVSPLEFYVRNLEERFGPIKPQPTAYGVPVFETEQFGNNFFIRLKDSGIGSHYATDCRFCPFFVDPRRCQEGIYQPWITPGLLMKLCRHRPDINVDLSEEVRRRNTEGVADLMLKMIRRYYEPSNLVLLE